MSAVLVTGATGLVGSAVVEYLLERGQPVVAAVREPATTESVPTPATPRAFDFEWGLGRLESTLAGVDRVFLMRPPAIADVQAHLFPFIDACLRRGVRQIVFLSLQGVQGNRSTPHHAVEQHLRRAGAPFTNLRPNFFMQNLITAYADEIRQRGEIVVPAGRARTAFVDARDVARVAATVLTQPGHERKSYTLSGEESLSYSQVAQTMTQVLNRPIRYTRPSEKEYLALLAANGYPQDYLDVQKMIHRVVRLNVSAFPNRAIRRLTGEPATTLRRFLQDHRTAWL